VVVKAKNTLIRRCLRLNSEKHQEWMGILPYIKGNMGFVFTNHDLNEVRNTIIENKVPAQAKSGTFAPVDVYVPAGPTGLDPGQTSFFQALNIGTKIARGSIEIINTVHLIKAGDKVTSSAVALLGKLDIKPFFYGVVVKQIYENGAVYPVHILDVTPDELLEKFLSGVRKIAALGLAIGYPTEASIPHSLSFGMKKLFALSFSTAYKFKESEALVKAAAAPAPKKEEKDPKAGKKDDKADKKGDKGKKEEKPKEVEKPKEEEEEEDQVGGFGDLFGGGGDD